MDTPPTQVLSIAMVVPVTEAEGPGKRFALWFQGCPLRCPGCCNPEMLSFDGGRELPVAELAERAIASKSEGISLLGGEPLAHAAPAAEFARRVREHGLSVM